MEARHLKSINCFWVQLSMARIYRNKGCEMNARVKIALASCPKPRADPGSCENECVDINKKP